MKVSTPWTLLDATLIYYIYPQEKHHANDLGCSNSPPTICVIQPKGGVGKTTLTFCLARYAVQYHKLRVLLIDTDKSANLSSLFLKPDQINENDHL